MFQNRVKVGRIAGRFAKSRSDPFEEKDGVKLLSYSGDKINRDAEVQDDDERKADESEEKFRNLDIPVRPSRRETQRVLKFLAVSGSLALLGTDPAFAVSQVPNGIQSFVTSPGDLGDISSGFASAFLLIFFSELGDKIFFIAALLAARNSAVTIFARTFGALGDNDDNICCA